jgi:hypothetical protein
VEAAARFMSWTLLRDVAHRLPCMMHPRKNGGNMKARPVHGPGHAIEARPDRFPRGRRFVVMRPIGLVAVLRTLPAIVRDRFPAPALPARIAR